MILVTGASGLLGSNLAMVGRDRGESIVGTFQSHPVRLPGVETVKAALGRTGDLLDIVRCRRPELVVHCAAATDLDWCESNPEEAREINAVAAGELAAAARMASARFVFISTDAAVDPSNAPASEDDPPRPVNIYGATKHEGEERVLQEHPDALVVRTNMYGWSPSGRRSLSEWIITRLEAGEEVPGFIDVHFNPVLVTDLSEIVLDVAELDVRGILNIAAADGCSKYDFARTLAMSFGYPEEQVTASSVEQVGFRAARASDTRLDTGRLRRIIGRPPPDIRSGLEKLRTQYESGWAAILRASRGPGQMGRVRREEAL